MKNRLTKRNILMQGWGSLLLSAVLSIVMPVIAHGSVSAAEFAEGYVVSFIASMLLKLLTPVIENGCRGARALGCSDGTPGFRLLSAAFQAFMMGTCMSLVMTWWQLKNVSGYSGIFLGSWLREYPWVLITVFIMINISMSTGPIVLGSLLREENYERAAAK